MNARELFQAGRLAEAVAAQQAEVKANPVDLGRRTFLFELLAFQGDLDRAGKQLDVVGQQEVERDPAAQIYRNLLSAEQQRRRLFSDGLKPNFLVDPSPDIDLHLQAINRLRESEPAEAQTLLELAEASRGDVTGELNGTVFNGLRDYDDVLAPVLEFFAGPDYFWVPLAQVRQLTLAEPKTPRDLLWCGCELMLADEVLRRGFMPVLYPGSHEHDDERVKLGRMTDWQQAGDDGPVTGVGQRVFLAGDEERAILEVRTVVCTPPGDGG